MSTTQSSPQPIDISSTTSSHSRQISSPSSSQSPTSALSASLKAFSDLSLANKPPVRLESDEFKQAYRHARRASFGNSASVSRPIISNDEPKNIPTLSTSPGSNTSDLSSLPTPSSSPLSTSAFTSPTSANSAPASAVTVKRSASNGGSGINKTAAVPILGGVCEKEEIDAFENGEFGHEEPASAPAAHQHARSVSNAEGSSLFGGGARWGWTSSGGNGTNSPPLALPQDGGIRRGSLTFASPPGSSTLPLPASHSTALSPSAAPGSVTSAKHSPPLLPASDPFARMQPLGRVVSAGAALQTPQEGSGSLFRRFSFSLGAKKVSSNLLTLLALPELTLTSSRLISQRPSPPSPPSLALPPRTETLTAPESGPNLSAQDDARRGRTLGAGSMGAKPKRKLSPMGEKFLRGGY